jgi:hypothetical protein
MKYWGKHLFYAMNIKTNVTYSNVLWVKYVFPLFFVNIKLGFQRLGFLLRTERRSVAEEDP